jgi:hypothetical protein
MYITDFICTYKKFEQQEETKSNENIDSDDIYRSQFLQAFKLEKWDYQQIEEKQNDLFFYVKNDINGMKILEVLLENKDKYPMLSFIFVQTDEKNNLEKMSEIFFILFSYELFDLFHNCLIDLFNKNKISDENRDKLINELIKY